MHKASSFDSQINFRSFTNLRNIEKSDESAINQQSRTHSEESRTYDALNAIRKKNPNRIIIVHFHIHTIRNKSEKLKEVIIGKTDILLISETNIDDTFPLKQFTLKAFIRPYRLDRTEHGGGLICFSLERRYLPKCYQM